MVWDDITGCLDAGIGRIIAILSKDVHALTWKPVNMLIYMAKRTL
jgi:hypothetical protein